MDDSFDISHGPNGTVLALAEDTLGRVYVGGDFQSYGTEEVAYLARIDANGSLDEAFDLELDGAVHALIALPDGGLFLAGDFTRAGGLNVGRSARLDSDGTVDPEYGVGLSLNGAVLSAALREDGAIYIGGAFTMGNGEAVPRIARLDPNGQLDLGFVISSAPDDSVHALTLDRDGGVYAGGAFQRVGDAEAPYVVHYGEEGDWNPEFASNLEVSWGRRGSVHQLLRAPDGGLYVVGDLSASLGGNTRAGHAMRVLPDGSVDRSYLSPKPAQPIVDAALDRDGKLVVAGRFLIVQEGVRSGYARLESDGSLDSGFSPLWGYVEIPGPISQFRTVDARVVLGLRSGGFLIGGRFPEAQGRPVHNLVKLHGGPSTLLPPEVIEVSQDVHALEGETHTLLARGVGNPPPEFLWQIDGRSPESFGLVVDLGPNSVGYTYSGTSRGATDTSITLHEIELTDAGTYVFEVTNPLGSSEVAIPVTVEPRLPTPGQPDLRFFAMPPSGLRSEHRMWPAPRGQLYVTGEFDSFVSYSELSPFIGRHNWDGRLDETFHPFPESDYEILDESGGGDFGVHALSHQSDGKIVLVGDFVVEASDGWRTRNLVRLLPEGAVDRSFFLEPEVNGPIHVVAPLPDGSMVVAGDFTSLGGANRQRIAQLTTDGTVAEGYHLRRGPERAVTHGGFDSQGRFVFGGWFTRVEGRAAPGLGRLLETGAFDRSYVLPTDFRFQPVGLAITEDDGAIVDGGFPGAALSRLTDEGELDPLFAIPEGLELWNVASFAYDPSTRSTYVAEGNRSTGGPLDSNRLLRLGRSGALDEVFEPSRFTLSAPRVLFHPETGLHVLHTAYNLQGVLRTGVSRVITETREPAAPSFLAGPLETSVAVGDPVMLQAALEGFPNPTLQWFRNGEPIIGANEASLSLGLAESREAGAYQLVASNTFGEASTEPVMVVVSKGRPGTINFDFNPGSGLRGTVLAIEPIGDDGFLLAGSLTEYDGRPLHNLARLDTTGALHESFGLVARPDAVVEAVLHLADERVLIGGSFVQVEGVECWGIALLEADGNLVDSFDLGSRLDPVGAPTADRPIIRTLEMDDRGRVYIGGDFLGIDGLSSPGVIRLHRDLTHDPSFQISRESLRVTQVQPMPDESLWVVPIFNTPTGAPLLFDTTGEERALPAGLLDPLPSSPQLARLADGSLFISGRRPTQEDPRTGEWWSPESGGNPSFGLWPTVPRFVQSRAIAADRNGGVFLGLGGFDLPVVAHINRDGVIDLDFLRQPDMGNVNNMALLPNGDLVVTGTFSRPRDLFGDGIVLVNGFLPSEPLEMLGTLGAESIQLSVTGGDSDQDYTLETTASLADPVKWEPAATGVLPGESLSLPLDDAPNRARFYRLVRP